MRAGSHCPGVSRGKTSTAHRCEYGRRRLRPELVSVDYRSGYGDIRFEQLFGRTNLAAGDHSVRLDDVADNCSISGGSTRTATLAEGDTAEVTFAVACTALPPATVDVTGTWDGLAHRISTLPQDSTADVTYVLRQIGDSVVVDSVSWVSYNGPFPSSFSVGRVSDSVFTMFDILPIEVGGIFRLTHTLAVSGTQMVGASTQQGGAYTDSLALTKQ